MEYQDYIDRAIQRLNKQAQTQTDTAEGWAMLAVAEELHKANILKEEELKMRKMEMPYIKRAKL